MTEGGGRGYDQTPVLVLVNFGMENVILASNVNFPYFSPFFNSPPPRLSFGMVGVSFRMVGLSLRMVGLSLRTWGYAFESLMNQNPKKGS